MIICPYCNTLVADDEQTCSRCGERIPPSAQRAAAPGEPWREQNAPDPSVPMPRRFSNTAVVLTILVVMVSMALLGLSLSLETVEFRRANDAHITKPQLVTIPLVLKIASSVWMVGLVLLLLGFWRKQESAEEPVTNRTRWLYGVGVSLAVLSTMMILFAGPIRRRSTQLSPYADQPAGPRVLKPAELEAWRYLPADTDIVVGVHVAELLEDPKSREFLDGLQLAALRFDADRLRSWTGLERQDLEYVVLGVRVEDHLKPRITLVARSRQALDVEQLRERLHATMPAGGDGNRFHFKVVGTTLEADAWCVPEDQLVIVGLTRGDREAWAGLPHEGLERMPSRLRAALMQRVQPTARAWAVGEINDWQRTPMVWWLAQQPEKDRDALKTVRSFSASLRIEKPLVVSAELESANEETADKISTFLKGLPKDLETHLKTAEKDGWVSVQLTLPMKKVQEVFKQ